MLQLYVLKWWLCENEHAHRTVSVIDFEERSVEWKLEYKIRKQLLLYEVIAYEYQC